jgi:methylmalonyl-CoA mutase
VPALKNALAALGRPDIRIVVGGVIPEQDIPALKDAGAIAVFTPGTNISDAARTMLDHLNDLKGFTQKR